ncbi:hypothetical protein prwr041_18520 [Prevotella herbatica]|uniref:Uncharacterized protein n=2 Tax=Prevotella herbatica TaxID=2801997 RepID=A0ABN6EJE7_9BACT|nr:hypothetical protein prwr041_18520 [Prevotella herbatica]
MNNFIKGKGYDISCKTMTSTGIIALDINKEIFIAINNKRCIFSEKVIPFSDIIACELVIDGESVYKKSTSRVLGGAIVGNVLAGGVGTVIGGLSGKSKKKEKIKSINLNLTLRDIENPLYIIKFYEYKGTDMLLDTIKKAAEEWKSRISAIIDKEDSKSK